MWKTLWVFVFVPILFSQSFDNYFRLLEQGRIQEVRDQLPELKSKYPYEPAVVFLQAMINIDGDSSIAQFQRFIKQYPDSPYTDDAVMKLGEYLYARGLYSQTSQQVKKIPNNYKNSNNIQRAVDLLVRSFEATGERDSARIYVKLFKKKYPSLQVSSYGFTLGNEDEKSKKHKADNHIVKANSKVKSLPMSYIVQLGAFGKYTNAKRLKKIVDESGYRIEIVEVMSNGKRLHAVRVVRFDTEKEAEEVGRELKAKYGVNFRVLKRPEK